MKPIQLQSERLIFRQLQPEDVPLIVEMAGDYDVSKMTLNIPYPYPTEVAVEFVEHSHKTWEDDTAYSFALVLQENNQFIGVIGLRPNMRHNRGEVGYWVGKSYWGKGYMTEALKRVIQFAFEELELNRVGASYLIHNPASGRVMEKAGMKHEGTFLKYYTRDDVPLDLHFRGITREDYDAQNS